MQGLQTTILIIHTLIALAIVALVLLQRGKGAEAGAAFGAGASGTVFGARGSTNFFSRTTAILATAFFATSLTLAYISSQRTGAPESLMENVPVETTQPQEQPAAPADGDTAPALPGMDSTEPVPESTDAAPPVPGTASGEPAAEPAEAAPAAESGNNDATPAPQ